MWRRLPITPLRPFLPPNKYLTELFATDPTEGAETSRGSCPMWGLNPRRPHDSTDFIQISNYADQLRDFAEHVFVVFFVNIYFNLYFILWHHFFWHKAASLCEMVLYFQMFHPYIIDTSVIYNLSGIPLKKTGLKRLSSEFLGWFFYSVTFLTALLFNSMYSSCHF